jgi:hypothetical protein
LSSESRRDSLVDKVKLINNTVSYYEKVLKKSRDPKIYASLRGSYPIEHVVAELLDFFRIAGSTHVYYTLRIPHLDGFIEGPLPQCRLAKKIVPLYSSTASSHLSAC